MCGALGKMKPVKTLLLQNNQILPHLGNRDKSLCDCHVLHFDGGINYNPGGTAKWGWVLYGPKGVRIAYGHGTAGPSPDMTVNVAEYLALEKGLESWLAAGRKGPLVCKGDSMLVVHCVTGKWRTHKPHLAAHRSLVRSFLARLPAWDVRWVPRADNAEADHLAAGQR